MDTLHKLAGVTEASSANEPPAQPVLEPTSRPQERENETDDGQTTSNRASRVSLPLNRRASHKSFRSSRREQTLHGEADAPPLPSNPRTSRPSSAQGRPSHDSAATGATGSEDEYTWGPNHPCFPHPNPHCPPTSEEVRSTRVIRVRRDWLQAGDVYPQYANLYPEILEPLVSDDEFRFLIANINTRVKSAFDPHTARAWIDAALGVVTGYIWDDLGLTGSKQGVKSLETFVDKWNAGMKRAGKDVTLVQLRSTGFMTMDFVVPDPGIDAMPEGGGGIGPAE